MLKLLCNVFKMPGGKMPLPLVARLMPKYFSGAAPEERGGNGQQHVVEKYRLPG